MKKDLSVPWSPKTSMKFISAVTILMMVVGLVSSTVAFAAPVAEESDSFGPIVRQAVKSDLSPPLRSIQPIPPEAADGGILEIPSFPLPKSGGGGSSSPELDVESTSGEMKMPSTIVNFEGVDNRNSVLPPDTQGDVGPNHYVQIVNLSFAIWNKSGTLLYGPANNNTIWSGFGGDCETHNNGDPIVLYDPLADRWLISQFALDFWTDFHECIAISETPDPTGAWHRYDFLYSTIKMNDYPKFGVWPDGYYMTVNQFTAGGWAGAGVVAYERDKMLVGDPSAQSVYFDLASVDINYGGMLPSDFDGTIDPPAGSPNYFAEWDDSSWIGPNDSVRIWEFHVDWANPANSTFGIGGNPNYVVDTSNVDPNMCNYGRNCIPQPGGSNVDAISDRLMFRLQYRNFGGYETLVANHTVDVGSDHAGIHWMELRDSGSGWTLHQDGVYAPDADHRWMGSIAMDRDGNIALGYSVSSTQTYPSIRYTGRMAGDPLGTLPQGEASVIAGSGYQTHSSGRWGDYSMMSVDPVDDCTFWYTQEYYEVVGSAPWQTRVGAFQFPTCAGDVPNIYVDPTSFDFEVPEGNYDSTPLTIGNVGGADLNWGISVVTHGAEPLGSGQTKIVTLGDATSDAIEAGYDLTTNASYATAVFTELTPILETSPGGTILWDLTHGVYSDYEPSGAFSTLVALLNSAGFTVSTTDVGLDNVDLSAFDIVVICIGSAYNTAYTPSEVAAVEAFVLNGGGLLIMGDNAGTPNDNINPVAQTFGSTCGVSDLDPLDLYITDLAPHPIFDSVGEIFFRAAGEVTASPPSNLVAFEPTGLGAVAVAEVGPGKIAVLGDINVWDNGYISTSSNQLFAENSFNWLVTPSGPFWLSADPLSGSVPPGGVDVVDVVVDSTGLAVGIYTGELLIYSNDPDESPLSVPVTMEVVPLVPDIEVDPTSVSSRQHPDTIEVKPLDILNVGTADLLWEIFEEEPSSAPQAGKGEWLYRSEEGVMMPVNGGGEALAYPSAYRWQPDNPSALINILIYADDYYHAPPNTFLDQALQILGLAYTAHYDADFAGFETSLAGGPWDLVLFGSDSWGPPSTTWTALDTYVNTGGKLILNDWFVGADPAHPLWSTLGFTYFGDDVDPPDPVYWWVPGHPFFNNPESVPEFTVLVPGRYFISYGQYVEPLPGFEALAGYTTPGPDPNGASLIFGNNNRTVFKGFTDGQNDADLDTDGLMDGVELWINMIVGLTEPVCTPGDIPWVSVLPAMGTTPPGGADPLDVIFDSTGLGAGTYDGNLCITSNDPDESLVVVPVELEVFVEPDIEVSPDSLSSEQTPDSVVVKQLDVGNVGSADLVWLIYEDLYQIVPVEITGSTSLDGYSLSSEASFAAPNQEAQRTALIGINALINDGSFENGPPPSSAWTEVTDNPCEWIGDWSSIWGVAAFEGIYDFWGGGYCYSVPTTTTVSQSIVVPAMENNLSFWYISYRPDPDDPDPDVAHVAVNGTPVWTLDLIQASDTYPNWVNVTLDLSAYAGQTIDLELAGISTGAQTGNIRFDFIEWVAPEFCVDPIDIPWITDIDPPGDTTVPGGSTPVDVTFDSTGMAEGAYNGNLCVTSNDPDESLVVVPVEMTVEVEPPDIEVDPLSVSSEQPPDTVEVKPLDISNVGGEDLIWEVIEEMPAVSVPASGEDFPRGKDAPSFGLPSVSNPPASSPSSELFEGLLAPGSDAYATESVYMNFTQLDLDIPEVLTPVSPYTTTYIWAGDFVGADFSKTYAIGENNMLVTIDTTSGAETVIGAMPAPPTGSIYTGMAYDPTTGTMFASSCDISVSHLYIVDLVTPSTTLVGEITNSPCTIAIGVDDAGQMYGHDLVDDVLISIDKATGAGTVIGSLGFDANYGQGMDFDSASGQLYLAAFNYSTYQAELRIADTTTGATALVGVLGQTTPGTVVQLGWLANVSGGGCIPGDISWVSVSPTTGTTPPGGTSPLDVTFDSTGLTPGMYEGNLCVLSNDPDESLTIVPVELEVEKRAPVPPADFDGDGDTDISVYHWNPLYGQQWYIKDQGTWSWGNETSIPVPADYDGDGDTDIAVYDRGTWYIKDIGVYGWGGPDSVPVPGDYDGDGDADIAVIDFHPIFGLLWYIMDQPTHSWGNADSLPVQTDYNGDGTTDVAVYNDGLWYIESIGVFGWGNAVSIPVPGDYNGDGNADLAVYIVESGTGTWYIQGQPTAWWGGPDSIPVPGDYNGDGITDIAVYHLGTWYVKGVLTDTWGGPDDYPLPAPDYDGDGEPH